MSMFTRSINLLRLQEPFITGRIFNSIKTQNLSFFRGTCICTPNIMKNNLTYNPKNTKEIPNKESITDSVNTTNTKEIPNKESITDSVNTTNGSTNSMNVSEKSDKTGKTGIDIVGKIYDKGAMVALPLSALLVGIDFASSVYAPSLYGATGAIIMFIPGAIIGWYIGHLYPILLLIFLGELCLYLAQL